MAGEAFKLFGSIFIDDKQAQNSLNNTSKNFEKTFKSGSTKAGIFVDNVGKAMSKVGSVMLGVSSTIGTAAMKMFIPYQESVAKISTLVSDSKVLESIKKDMMIISNELGIDAVQVGDAIYQGLSSGVKPERISEFTNKMAKLAKGGLTEVATATDLTTTIINSYGMSLEDTTRISDVLIQVQNRGKTTVGLLGANMGKVIPTAEAYGVELEQVASGYALMTAKGIATAESTTYMNSMLDEMGKSGGKASDVIKKMSGKSFPELIASGKSVGDILSDMETYARKSNKSLNDMFGSSEAGKAAMLLVTDSGKAFNTELEHMRNSIGESDKAFQKMDNTLKARIDKVLQKIKNSFIRLGEAILPLIESKIVPAIEKFSDWISNLDDAAIENIASWVMWGVKVGGALMVLGPIVSTVGKVISAFGNLSGAVGTTTGAVTTLGSKVVTSGGIIAKLATVAGSLVNPFTLAVGGIVAVGGAIVANEKKIKKGTEEFNNMGISLDDFSGKLRTNESIWSQLFGKEYKLKFSDELKSASSEIETDTNNIIYKLEEMDEKIKSISNDENLNPAQKAEKIKEVYKVYVEEQKTYIKDIETMTIDHIMSNSETLNTFLTENTSLSNEQINEQVQKYKRFMVDQQTDILENENKILEIKQGAYSSGRELTKFELEEIERLTLENGEKRVTFEEMTGSDILNIMSKHSLEINKLNDDNATASEQNVLTKIESMGKYAEANKIAFDKEMDIINQSKFLSNDERANWIRNITEKRSKSDAFGNYLTNELMSKHRSYGDDMKKISGETMRQFVSDLRKGEIKAEDFGMTNEEAMSQVVQAFIDAGLNADELTEAIEEIPHSTRVDVLSQVDGKDKVDLLEQAIAKVKDKKVTISAITSSQSALHPYYAKGSEGINPSGISNVQRALVGEQGPEIVDLPRGAKVKTHRETRNTKNEKEPIYVSIQLDGKTIASAMASYLPKALGNRNRQLGLGGSF